MSLKMLIAKEIVSHLRGIKIPVYFALVGIIAFGYIFMISNQLKTASPSENIISAGLFLILLIIFCVCLFTADGYFGDARHGNISLQLLIPKNAPAILNSMLLLPMMLYFIGILVFTLFILAIPNDSASLKLWFARLLVDTLLFFTLLYLSMLISTTFRSGVAPMLTVSLLLLFLFFSPYTNFQIPYLSLINPVFYEYNIIADFQDGWIDDSIPLLILFIFLLTFMILSNLKMIRMEVDD